MKILFIMQGPISYGGVESVVLNLWKEYIKLNFQVDFLCPGKDIGLEEDKIKRQGSKVFHVVTKKKYFKLKKEFNEIICNNKYDVIHANANATSGIYLKWAKEKKIPVLVAHSHASRLSAYIDNPIMKLVNWLEKFKTRKYANLSIACSQAAGNWLFGGNDFIVIPNGINVEKFSFKNDIRRQMRKHYGISDDMVLLINVGSLWEVKNQVYLLNVMSKLVYYYNIKKYRLFIIGDGYLKEKLENKIKELSLTDYVMLLGKKDNVSDFLQAADVFLLPSYTEGNPVSLTEAAVSGLKCVVSEKVPNDIIRYFSKEIVTYLPISEKDVTSWCECINKIKFDNYQRDNYMIYNFDKTYMAERIVDLYKKTLESFSENNRRE